MVWCPFYDTALIKSHTNWQWSVRWNFTTLLYLPDQEDQGAQHHPENTAETKHQSLETDRQADKQIVMKKETIETNKRKEIHSMKTDLRNYFWKQVAIGDLEQLRQ